MMLNAFKQILDNGIDAKLLIVGDGEMRDDIEVLIKTLSLSQHVIMTGYQAKPYHHLALMDIYLLSSLSEGTSMTLLEAMSIGKPCVVTDAGGNPEIIKHGINGMVTPNDNANAFAKGIETIATDTSLKESMAKKAHQIFEEKFSAASMVAQFHSLYQKITK